MIEKIISGGQTGVDRAALDVALTLAIPHGGWCAAGRQADDGPIPAKYQLVETAHLDHTVRSEFNIKGSDGTLMIYRGELHGGTAYAVELAKHLDRPVLTLNLEQTPSVASIIDWIKNHNIKTLHIGGQREINNPGIYAQAYTLINALCRAAAAPLP